MHLLLSWLLSAASFLLASYLLPGLKVESFGAAMVAAAILGICNAIVRPILVLLTLPFTVLTLGLFLFVVNGIVLALAVSFVPGVAVAGLGWAILAAILISLFNSVLGALLMPKQAE